ncbi:family 16 glycoside hydrolase [Oerskovia sp. M15]
MPTAPPPRSGPTRAAHARSRTTARRCSSGRSTRAWRTPNWAAARSTTCSRTRRSGRTLAQFLRHVKAVAKGLIDDSRISGKERQALVNAAARSQIGVEPGGYRTIFDGTQDSLFDWVQLPGGKFDLQADGSLRSSGGLGMLWYEAEELGDFSVKLLFRDVSQGTAFANSGVFTRFPDPTAPGDAECAEGSPRVGGDLLRSRDPDLRRPDG